MCEIAVRMCHVCVCVRVPVRVCVWASIASVPEVTRSSLGAESVVRVDKNTRFSSVAAAPLRRLERTAQEGAPPSLPDVSHSMFSTAEELRPSQGSQLLLRNDRPPRLGRGVLLCKGLSRGDAWACWGVGLFRLHNLSC